MAQLAEELRAARQGSLTLGNLSINFDNFRVVVGAEAVELTYLEVEVLRFLLLNPNRVIPYDELTQSLWQNSERSSTRHLAVLIHRLRAKLVGLDPYVIETVRNRGYGLLRSRNARRSSSSGPFKTDSTGVKGGQLNPDNTEAG